MRNSSIHISAFCGLLFLLFSYIPADLFAFQQTGVIWNPPESKQQAQSELTTFRELGVDLLEVQHPVRDDVLQLLEASAMDVLIRSGVQYLSLSELSGEAEALQERYSNLIRQYNSFPNIEGLVLVSGSPLTDTDYAEAFEPLLNSLQATTPPALYFYQNQEWRSFSRPDLIAAVLYPDQEFSLADLQDLDQYLTLQNIQENAPVLFMHDTWLLEAAEAYPELANSLRYLDESGEWLLPLPEPGNPVPDLQWTVLLLLALWLATGIHFLAVPSYRSFISRYFGAHRFWVEDIIQYRERSAASGLILVLQHALFGGLVFFMLASTFMTETGVQAFFHHFPYLGITGYNVYTFFSLGTVIVLLFQCIALLWLYFSSEILHRFSQVLNLYTGVFHLDFIIVTIMVVLFMNAAPWYLILPCGVIYGLIWYLAFNIAALDTSQHMIQQRGSFLFYTIGLHAILSITALILILVFTDLIEVLDLALNI